MSCDKFCAHVLLNLSNLLQESDKMLGKPRILSLFPNSFNKFNNTGALIFGPLCLHMTVLSCPDSYGIDVLEDSAFMES